MNDFAMKSMKVEKMSDSTSTEALLANNDSHEFPYGLRLRLDPKIMEKMDLEKMPEVGQTMGLHAVVEVVEVSLDRNESGGRDKCMSLQITDMALQVRSNDSLGQVAKENEMKEKNDTLLG